MSKSFPERKCSRYAASNLHQIYFCIGRETIKFYKMEMLAQEACIFSLRYIAHFDKEKFSLGCL